MNHLQNSNKPSESQNGLAGARAAAGLRGRGGRIRGKVACEVSGLHGPCGPYPATFVEVIGDVSQIFAEKNNKKKSRLRRDL
jgi:hypothetical protein